MSDLFRKRYASSLSTSAIESEIESLDNTTNSSFQTAIVKDVISNPISYFSRTYKEELDLFDAAKAKDSGKAVSNADLVEFAPRNSILAFNISSADAQGEKNPEIFFPFFPIIDSFHWMEPYIYFYIWKIRNNFF